MKTRNLAISAIFIAATLTCYAWGAAGHKLVAKIAYNQLNAALKDSLNLYLGGATVEEASVWMDEIKADKSYDFQKPWHYINIDKDSSLHLTDSNNIVWELNRIIPELKERQKYSKAKIEIDLKILIHLLGDLHQPLHVGYGVDEGGNKITVYYAATASNLHRVWDADIIKDAVLGRPLDWANTNQFSKEELARIRHIDVVDWLNDSRAKLDTVYEFKGDNITHKYVEKNATLVERQLLLGGIRLGAVLRYIFKS